MTDKQRLFVEWYVATLNATAAAKRAGYSAKTAYSIGSENLRKPEIRDAIEARLDELSMSAAEATMRLTRWGRGTFEPFLTEEGRLDLNSPAAREAIGLVRRMKVTERFVRTEDGEEVLERRTEIEIHDAKDAVVQIAKIRGLFKDTVEYTGRVLLLSEPDRLGKVGGRAP